MHTTALDSCRIHHNGDFGGEIIITNSDSTSKPVGPLRTIKFTVRKLVNLQRRLERSSHMEVFAHHGKVTLKGNPNPEYDEELTILQKDVEDFLAIRLMDKIEEKMGSTSISYETITYIARGLGIKE